MDRKASTHSLVFFLSHSPSTISSGPPPPTMAAAVAAEAAIAADHILKTGEVSALLKLGFLPSPAFSPSRTSHPSPSSISPSRTSHPSPPPSSISPSRTSHPSPPLSSTSLLDLIADKNQQHHHHSPLPRAPLPLSVEQRRARLQERVSGVLSARGYADGDGDVELTVRGGDGFGVEMRVHRRVLARKSRFFAEKLVVVEGKGAAARHVVEICECDDVEVYVEVVALMYCGDLRRRVGRMGVGKVLALLKVSEAVMFDDGVASCLAHLEAVPWSKEEEDKVVSALSNVRLYRPVSDALQRVYMEPSTSSKTYGIISRILVGVLHAKDEKARREMKALVLKLLKEDGISRNNEERETLYSLCHKCLSSTFLCMSEAVGMAEHQQDCGALMGGIGREADNLLWMVEILINKRIGEEFVLLWADQKELAALHAKLPCVYRFEISKITAQLCVAIGQGQVLVPKDARFSLLQTWLEALYDDFGWMKRGCRSVDRKTVEDGLSQTILTLTMAQQQMILLNWFERFLNKGDDCPNIRGAFETWWRRAFVRQRVGDLDDSQLQIAVRDYPS